MSGRRCRDSGERLEVERSERERRGGSPFEAVTSRDGR